MSPQTAVGSWKSRENRKSNQQVTTLKVENVTETKYQREREIEKVKSFHFLKKRYILKLSVDVD